MWRVFDINGELYAGPTRRKVIASAKDYVGWTTAELRAMHIRELVGDDLNGVLENDAVAPSKTTVATERDHAELIGAVRVIASKG